MTVTVTGTITGPLFVTKPTVLALGQQVTVTINVDAFATVAWRKVFSYLAAELRSGDIAASSPPPRRK
ncbi:hypothetical protein ORV05_08030 [Amycolatopsis cynarae]|uniref:Uncharacterized protein n=1 Tax=Amycolatopsis cynarae TaxID=2995223 RepID=A0ABY7B5V8_9PSEU|nr:hypothetical protein [Amycolatopsis sp. HUAS 11-8]WAL67714.1 hypothetical protein ORV05_08030 [Amycolatopsis sp. HUAS 11-8]